MDGGHHPAVFLLARDDLFMAVEASIHEKTQDPRRHGQGGTSKGGPIDILKNADPDDSLQEEWPERKEQMDHDPDK